MTQSEIERLRFRRQYLLTTYKIECPFLNNLNVLNENTYLYTHIDLNVTLESSESRKIVLIGDMFDFEFPDYDNRNILEILVKYDFETLIPVISRYSGRWVLIYSGEEGMVMLHDASASRKVYYYSQRKGMSCSSNPHLLATALKIPYTSEEERLAFYYSDDAKKTFGSNIGNLTIYDGVFQLMPNHYLDLINKQVTRFWPCRRIEKSPLEQVVEKSSAIIKGYMESITNRYKVMLPVTAGKDSRILLAATKNRPSGVFYYLNKERWLNEKSQDVYIPQRLLPKLSLKHNLVDPYVEIDEDFKKMYFENNRFASALFLPVIYNYYLNFSDRINLPGTFINIIEEVYEIDPENISGGALARLHKLDHYKFVVNYYQEWYEASRDRCIQSNISAESLFFWEERMANWGTQLQLDKDIAQEEIIPFNSMLLIENMLKVPLNLRQKPDYILHREIIRKLWPEALQEPFNSNFTKTVLKMTKSLGIMKPAKAVYRSFLFDPVRYLNKLRLVHNSSTAREIEKNIMSKQT